MATTSSFQTPQKGSSPIGSLHCHVFAGSKGGTGKTTVLFHAASQYAKDNPDVNVLIVDCSFAGDVSERLLGGAAEINGRTTGEAAFEKLYKEGKSSQNLFRYLFSNMSAEMSAPGTSGHKTFTDIWRRTFVIDGQSAVPPPTPPPQNQLINVVDKFGVRVSEHNSRFCAQNLFLIPGGGNSRQPCAGFDDLHGNLANTRRLAIALREHLAALPGTYKVYFDTDGELDMSVTLQVVVRACDSIALFTETDPSDFRRVRVFLEDLLEIRRLQMVEENSCAGIAAVVFNKVEPDTRRQPFTDLGCSITPHMVAARSLILSFAQKASSVVLNPETQFIRLGMFTNIPQLAPGASKQAKVTVGDYLAESLTAQRF